MDNDEAIFKVNFNLGELGWDGAAVESLWAERVGEGVYCLRNSPWFVRGVSFLDLVNVVEKDDVVWFDSISEKSGWSTIRLRWRVRVRGCFHRMYFLWKLDRFGCSREGGYAGDWWLVSISVPNGCDKSEISSVIERGVRLSLWEAELSDIGVGGWPEDLDFET